MSNPKLEFFDTHTHIQFPDYPLDAEETWQSARVHGVTRLIAVGCRTEDSRLAVNFARGREGVWAAVGIHPHEAANFLSRPDAKHEFEALLTNARADKIVAIGEIGLDYYYENSSKEKQAELLRWQLGLAEKYDLPVIFHIREAFEDFWPIFDQFNVKKGLIHSFTGVKSDVEQILKRNLSIALNGIITFTSQVDQIEAAKAIPLDALVIETDAPYLTPKPLRGKICKPEHVVLTAKFLAGLYRVPLEELACKTTCNARAIFNVE